MDKRLYRKILAGPVAPASLDHPARVRHPTPNDSVVLARLMLDGYRGTIDYEDEEFEDAMEAIYDYFDNDPMPSQSHVVMVGDEATSAVLVSRRADGEPLVSYVMTAPRAKGRGRAAQLLELTLAALTASGESSVCAYITDGNTPSARLFMRAGFVEVDHGAVS